ncbi:MAG: leucine-rich repeat domain-containing protein [Drouetiella hepatica Uher 2000/2452]|jgi:Leucine-rich repeat (LRR) protein|uniref:non-specific serine/threonine protein kinase n=1 Tax=Drouetiella hepatica Uher 2000/2452 TaxID=904376 RepID=A0A951QAR3_9CYAN|nr:leucine-rich repeat domain-containing protein [Drouetiella hepatica Uher 2000/2452]
MIREELLELIDRAADEVWTELDLSGKELTELPAEIGKLTQLETLILGKVEKWQWAEGKSIPTVTTNQLTVLPQALEALENLKTLRLSGNPLRVIPEVILGLRQLEYLNLTSVGLLEIPDSIAQLTNLTQLRLHSNQISTIPDSIAQLTNLTQLRLHSNQISTIPESIAQLTNLTTLDLSSNQISTIPESIAQLTNLTELYLHSNQISTIPESIAQLTNLTELYLSSNQITAIPDSIAQLTNLTQLRLHINQISIIPESIAQLTNLTELSLRSNQITAIPDSIAQLTNLTELSLRSNQITAIPDSIAQLTNLTQLRLNSNQISVIPESIAQLTNLTELYLNSNQITAIPDSIAQLTNLTELSLRSNQITAIPDSIAQLTNLMMLDLEKNQVTQIPKAVSQLAHLEKLDLRSNPISIPPDILAPKEGEKLPDARPILDYYFRIQDPTAATQLYEAKILIVGEGGAGKTSLARKLLDSDYSLPPETQDTSTQGIDILRWEFTGRNQQVYKVNLWDFGGQEIYHQTHQFFLTERSLYLLVADSRKEDTDHYFWLQIIRLLSDDSPVLLIQNEKLDRTCNLNLRELRAEFANLKPPLSTNLADNRGLSAIQTAIQHSLEDLLPDGIPFPTPWLNVRYSLENDGRNYIDCADYEATCRYHGILKREEMFDLSRFLHSLGICLHFQKDPILRYRLILKPNWGTAAVYKILDNPTVKQQLGQFSDADLNDIWQAQQYADMRSELLQLMKAFKVCYEIPRREGHYIAPHLLSPDSPYYDWDTSQNLLLRYRYKGFMPKGILTRFIVEMHKLIENVSDPDQALVWKTGVVLVQDRARAEVTERYHNREIRIRLSGSHQRDFLVALHYEFQKIHDTYERLEYDTLIPCNCTHCKTQLQPFPFPRDRLQRCIEQGRPTIECHESGENVNVRRLLDDTIDSDIDRKFYGKDGELDKMEALGRGYIGDRFNIHIHNTNQQGDHKPVTENTNNLQGANIGNFANEVKDNARQQANQHIHQAPSHNLAQAAQDIQDLLNHLDQTYDRTTPIGQAMISAKAIESIEKNPTLKARIINALKEGGTTALEEAIDHPAVKPVIALVKGFIEAE